jgi:protein-disulfide isomerase
MSTTTPTKKEARDHAREERKRREQEELLHAQRRRRLLWIGGGIVGLIAIVAIVMAVSSGGGSSSTSASTESGVAGAKTVSAEFDGIEQNGNVLGSSSAPATMVVFADMQCPFCRQFETQAFPQIVKRYVKPGKLRVIFQPISILGTDSVAAAHAVASAGQQNRMFEYASLFYDNQGQENSGYVTTDFMTKLAEKLPDFDVKKWRSELGSETVSGVLAKAQSEAQRAQIQSTPSFMIGKTGKPLEQFQPNELTAAAFYGKLDQLTK